MATPNHTRRNADRAKARATATSGCALLAQALNHCANPALSYRYDDAAQARFVELMTELVQLVEHGRIEDLRPARAKADPAFQAFIAAAGVRHG